MSNESIYIAIIFASIATYLCRAAGVFFSKNIIFQSHIFNWIQCVSIGVIVAVIIRMILFPTGILEDTMLTNRIIASITLINIYIFFKKNILLSVLVSTIIFIILNIFI